MKNRVKVSVLNSEYTVVAQEDEQYIQKVAEHVDKTMREFLSSSGMSTSSASILTCINICDQYFKASESCDRLREQIKQYLDDAKSERNQADEARKEIMRLRSQIQELKIENQRLRNNSDAQRRPNQ